MMSITGLLETATEKIEGLFKPKYTLVSFNYKGNRINILIGSDEIKVKTRDYERLRSVLETLEIQHLVSSERRTSSNKHSTFRIYPTDSKADLETLYNLPDLLPSYKKNGSLVSSSTLPRKIDEGTIFENFKKRNVPSIAPSQERWRMPQRIKAIMDRKARKATIKSERL